MPNSYFEYSSGLSSTTFSVPFNTLSFSDVKAMGYNGSAWTDLTIATRDPVAKTITLASTPSSFQKIRVWRQTAASQLVDFQSGSRLAESDLDTAYQQGLFVAQEVSENASTVAGSIGPTGIQGPQGPQGPAGQDGVDGVDGQDGTDGVNSAPVPAGSIIYTAANTAPTGYLKADGSNVNRNTYSDLFAAIGTTYGLGNGLTFGLPDLRGEFIRGWDDSRGVDSGRGFGSAQDFNASYLKTVQVRDPNGSSTSVTIPQSGFSSWNLLSYYSSGSGDSMRFENSGGEARPRNVALLACIKF